MPSDKKVIFVVGPTASGKSKLALELALNLKINNNRPVYIFNADSIQMYQALDIGSAKPSMQERLLVPHVLFDIIPVGQDSTAGQFRKIFFEELEKTPKNSVIFVVGGTGFYLQAIEKGMFDAPPVNPEMQRIIQQELSEPKGPEKLFHELQLKDPSMALKISINDHYRLGRFIEIIRTNNISVTDLKLKLQNQQQTFPYPLLKLGVWLNRERLVTKIQLRTNQMLQQGFINEVLTLLKFDSNLIEWSALKSVGYLQVLNFIIKNNLMNQEFSNAFSNNSKLLIQSLEDEINLATIQLTKKQKTWFKRDSEIQWFYSEEQENLLKAIEVVKQFVFK